MDDLAILAIWFSSVIGGMVLTMLMPQMLAESLANNVHQGEVCALSYEPVHSEMLQGKNLGHEYAGDNAFQR